MLKPDEGRIKADVIFDDIGQTNNEITLLRGLFLLPPTPVNGYECFGNENDSQALDCVL